MSKLCEENVMIEAVIPFPGPLPMIGTSLFYSDGSILGEVTRVTLTSAGIALAFKCNRFFIDNFAKDVQQDFLGYEVVLNENKLLFRKLAKETVIDETDDSKVNREVTKMEETRIQRTFRRYIKGE